LLLDVSSRPFDRLLIAGCHQRHRPAVDQLPDGTPALGRQGVSPLQDTSDRGGAIPIATADLLAERPGLAAAAAAHAAYDAETKAAAK